MEMQKLRQLFQSELQHDFSDEEIQLFYHYYLDDKLGVKLAEIEPNIDFCEAEILKDLEKLKNNVPYQQIVGFAHFFDLKIKVNQHTLIPRPETEELVDWIVKDHQENQAIRILDIGTGSGCIAIALKKMMPKATVMGMDISPDAIEIAKQNAKLNEAEVEFVVQDILSLSRLEQAFDLIVSNPPYIRNFEKSSMHENVLKYEPSTALFVSDEHPLVFYEKIVQLAQRALHKDGALYFEINQYLGKEMKELVAPYFELIELQKDISGNDRMLKTSKIKR